MEKYSFQTARIYIGGNQLYMLVLYRTYVFHPHSGGYLIKESQVNLAGRHDEYFAQETIQKWNLSWQPDSLAAENWSWLCINVAVRWSKNKVFRFLIKMTWEIEDSHIIFDDNVCQHTQFSINNFSFFF